MHLPTHDTFTNREVYRVEPKTVREKLHVFEDMLGTYYERERTYFNLTRKNQRIYGF